MCWVHIKPKYDFHLNELEIVTFDTSKQLQWERRLQNCLFLDCEKCILLAIEGNY